MSDEECSLSSNGRVRMRRVPSWVRIGRVPVRQSQVHSMVSEVAKSPASHG